MSIRGPLSGYNKYTNHEVIGLAIMSLERPNKKSFKPVEVAEAFEFVVDKLNHKTSSRNIKAMTVMYLHTFESFFDRVGHAKYKLNKTGRDRVNRVFELV